MTKKAEMYHILEKMVESTIMKDKDELTRLNITYDALSPKVRHPSDWQLEYDRCRQSCVLSGEMPGHEEFISDAKVKFSKINIPER